MSVVRKEYSYPSKTGLSDIFARSWAPENGQVKAVFQITHGMAEHGERYLEFAEKLCELGFAVFVNDHIGHGKSVKSDDDLGYFGEKGGWNAFVDDARQLTVIAEKEYPGLPVIFFGHSMGSFVAREYAATYGYDPAIKAFAFCGTSGPNPGAPAGITMANALIKIKGSRYRSKLIDKIAFGSYLKKIPDSKTAFDWLTHDEEIVKKYIDDKYCGFLFTLAGFKDMFSILSKVSQKEWAGLLEKSKPVLLVSGSMDPVGSYGKGVQAVYDSVKDAGVKDVTLKLFEGDRHEIHNELDRADVYEFIGNWALSKI